MGESQEDSSEHGCQKCGKHIQQVAYKYEGRYYHARCLKCNTCGKKLAGRPFLIVQNKIFCGEQCQDSYQEDVVTVTPVATVTITADKGEGGEGEVNPQRVTSNGHGQQKQDSESLLEALTSTEQTAPSPQTSLRGTSPTATVTTRLTDYPGHTLSQSPGSIRRTSLSVSESSLTGSFTSEGSFGFDGSARPRKQILKKPHGPRRHKKSNRVRWNIPEEEEEEEGGGGGGGAGDSVSLLSFESTTTSTSLGFSYQEARNSVNESRRNWREFERQPPAGSTGLTPSKPSLTTLRENYVDVGYTDHSLVSPSSSLTQREGRPVASLPPSRSPPTRPQRYSTRTGGGDVGTRHGSTELSPLSPLHSSTRVESGYELRHTSTPLRPLLHENGTAGEVPSSTGRNGDVDPAHSVVAPPLTVPLLILDRSDLTDLEASTFEDRAKCNLFEIPAASAASGNSRAPRGSPGDKNPTTPGGHSGENVPPKDAAAHLCEGSDAHLCEGSDADDYDHLSPHFTSGAVQTLAAASNRNNNVRYNFFPRPSQTKTRRSKEQPPRISHGGPPNTGNRGGKTNYYGDGDIDEALNDLNDSASSSRSGSSDPQSPVPNQYSPPGDTDNDGGLPPPVPPKLRRRKSASPPTTLPNGLRSSISPSSCSSSASDGGGGGGNRPKNSRHPPEFATGPANVVECSDLSQEEAYEDAISSISTATLVPSELGEPISLHSIQHLTVAPDQSRPQQTKFNQTNGGRGTTADVASKRVPAGAYVHPETFTHHSLSRQSWDQQQQWRESGAKSVAHHPPPLPYNHHRQQPPPMSSYTRETPIEEHHHNPKKRQTLISVSTSSGSDSSLRGVSPPHKISQAVVQTHAYSQSSYYYPDDSLSLSQPLPTRPILPHTFPAAPRGPNFGLIAGASKRRHPQVPHVVRNPPNRGGGGGNVISRNHRLYHSHRSGLGSPRFSHAQRPSDDATGMRRTLSPPNTSRRLPQDGDPLGAKYYRPPGLVGGQRTARILHRGGVDMTSPLVRLDKPNTPTHNGHVHSQTHTHPSQAAHNTRTMTAV